MSMGIISYGDTSISSSPVKQKKHTQVVRMQFVFGRQQVMFRSSHLFEQHDNQNDKRAPEPKRNTQPIITHL